MSTLPMTAPAASSSWLARNVRGPRLLDPGVFLVREFRRKARLGQCRGESGKANEPATVG